MRSWVAGIIVIVAAMLSGGCEKPIDPLSRLVVQPGRAAELGYGVQWQTDLSLQEGSRLIYAEILGDRLVTLESGNVAAVIDTATGGVLWRAPVGHEIEQFAKPIRVGEQLIFTSARRAHIYDLNHGDLLRVFDLIEVSNTTPVIYQNTMIHGSPSGVVFAQDLNLGLLRWRYQTGAGISTNPVMAGPSLVVANDAGNVLAFNPDTGTVQWREDTFGSVTAQLAATDRLIYVPSQDQSLYAFVRNTGKQAWRHYATDPLSADPFLVAGLVIQRVPDEGLVALDENTGEVIWKREGLANARPLMVSNDKLYVHHRDSVLALSVGDGETIEQVRMPAVHTVVADRASTTGDMYLIRLNGPIMKITRR